MFMLLLFVYAISGFGDDRSIYLVLMEGDPVLFSLGAAPLEKEKKLEWLHRLDLLRFLEKFNHIL